MDVTTQSIDPSEYPAPLFDAVHRGNPGDVAFYRRVCRGASEVLELGCGTGRIAAQLRADGIRVTGIDLDATRVAIAASKGIDARVADLRDFSLGRRFPRVIAPYNTLYCLLDETDLLACLLRVRDHLAPGGHLVFDGYAADAQHFGASEEEARAETVEFVGSVEWNGATYDVLERGRWDRDRQQVRAYYEHIPRGDGPRIETYLPQRYLLRDQVDRLLNEAGLVPLWIHGDFDGRACGPDAEHFVVCAAAKP
jgi:SAM-dependent methyltransferase